MAGGGFLDCHQQVFAIGRVGRFRLRLDRLEQLRAFQALLAELHFDHVKNLPRRNGQLAADDAVLGFDIALDFNPFDIRFAAFLNFVNQIHRSHLRVRIFARADQGIDVAFRAIHVLDRLQIFGQPFGSENGADRHLQVSGNLIGRKERHAREIDGADPIPRSLGKHKVQHQFAGRFINPPQPRQFHDFGKGLRTFAQFDYRATANDTLRLLLANSGSNFEIPNTAEEQEQGRDLFQRSREQTAIFTWEHSISADSLLVTSLFERLAGTRLLGTSDPLSIQAQGLRNDLTVGARGDYTRIIGSHHTIKAGLEMTLYRLREP